ncbi:MAG TPA: hypothetical protein VF290_06530 [Pyrinomonadaceae bacterium]
MSYNVLHGSVNLWPDMSWRQPAQEIEPDATPRYILTEPFDPGQ